MNTLKAPWRDYSGRVSPLKATVFVALFLPGCWTAGALALGALGARPLTEAIHEIGLWTLRLIFIALLVTPASRLLHWPRLNLVRRMIGVAACIYGLCHISLYTVDESLNLPFVAAEIIRRIYLTIGFTALLGLAALAVTSTDGMIRRLGPRRWQWLHRLIYVIGILVILHYFMQSKLEEWEPTVMAGILVWLLGWRLLAWLLPGERRQLWIAATLTIIAAAATALGEAGWFWFHMGAPFTLVLAANLSLETGLRPAPIVLAFGVLATLAGLARIKAGRRRRGTPPRARRGVAQPAAPLPRASK